MKKLYIVFLIVISLLLVSCSTFTSNEENKIKNEPIKNPTEVTLVNDLIANRMKELDNFDYFENQINIGYIDQESLDELLETLKVSRRNVRTIEKLKIANIKLDISTKEALEKIQKLNPKGIKFAEPNFKRELDEPTISKNEMDTRAAGIGDDLTDYQWAINNKHLRAEEAWKIATGKGVIVSIMDGGSDSSHPDLSGQYADGFDSYHATLIPANTSVPYGDHGTHVSGIVAAKNDGKGITGLSPEASLMVAPVFVPGFVGDFYVANNVIWSVDNGAKILQNSWGGPGYSDTLKLGFDYALTNNAIVVVSTGNTHINENWGSPNSLPGIIGVGASDVNGKVSKFSSRGDSVSVVAPGVQILSTIPVGSPDVSTLYGPYAYWDGTSMASPYVSALAALLFEKHPDATAYQIRKLIESTADDKGNPGWDEDYGYGVINPVAALNAPLPSKKGSNYIITVTDSTGSVPLSGVYVTLKRVDGPSYYARTDSTGKVGFYQIDPDTYDVIIGGPDLLASSTLILRGEEQNSITLEDKVISDGLTNESIKFKSTIEIKLNPPTATGNYSIDILNSNFGRILTKGFDSTTNITEKDIITPVFYIGVSSDNMPSLPAPFMTDDFETEDFSGFDWVTQGDGIPTVIEDPNDPTNHIVSFPDLDNEQESSIATVVTLDPATFGYKMSFDYKVSSEQDWDFFIVEVNGTTVFRDSGLVNWTTQTINLLAGENTIEFVYKKDQMVSSYEDTAWLDNVSISKIPDDYGDYAVTGDIIINGKTIPINHSLYNGPIIDEFDGIDAPYTIY